MPVPPVAVGLAIEAAKDGLEELAGACPTVDLVVVGGAREEIPDHPGIVWLTATTNVVALGTRGSLGQDAFDLQLLIEASTKWQRVPAVPAATVKERQAAADRVAERETRARRWTMAGEIAAALKADPAALDVASSELTVSSEHTGFVDGYWIARVYGFVHCTKWKRPA